LKEDAVRRAVARAIVNQAVTEAAWPDHGEASATLVPPLVLGPAAEGVPSPHHDLGGAQELLDRAGWLPGPGGVRARDGRPLTLSLLTSRPDEAARAMEAVGEQLARVGIGVEVIDGGPDPRAALARVNEAAFDLFLDIRPQDDANPCALCRFFSIRPGGQLSVAGAVGGGEQADLLFDRAFAALSLDSARRHAAELMHLVTAGRRRPPGHPALGVAGVAPPAGVRPVAASWGPALGGRLVVGLSGLPQVVSRSSRLTMSI
jgi:hypothetical protein